MRLLLTSAGITNRSLARALRELAGKEMRIAFIPTASNIEKGDKDWLIDNYDQCRKLGPTDIVDIAAIERKDWLPRLRAANVIFVGGGDPPYLMKWVVRSGLKRELPELLRRRVYVGISAGSIIMSRRLSASSESLYGDGADASPPGLGYVNFNLRPHLNSPDFPKVRDRRLRAISKRLEGDLYALDDDSGLVYTDGKIQIISEGRWKRY